MIYFGFVIVVVVAVSVVAASQVRCCFLDRARKLEKFEETLLKRKQTFFEANRRKRPARGERNTWLQAAAEAEALVAVKQEPTVKVVKQDKKGATVKGQPSKPNLKKRKAGLQRIKESYVTGGKRPRNAPPQMETLVCCIVVPARLLCERSCLCDLSCRLTRECRQTI